MKLTRFPRLAAVAVMYALFVMAVLAIVLVSFQPSMQVRNRGVGRLPHAAEPNRDMPTPPSNEPWLRAEH